MYINNVTKILYKTNPFSILLLVTLRWWASGLFTRCRRDISREDLRPLARRPCATAFVLRPFFVSLDYLAVNVWSLLSVSLFTLLSLIFISLRALRNSPVGFRLKRIRMRVSLYWFGTGFPGSQSIRYSRAHGTGNSFFYSVCPAIPDIDDYFCKARNLNCRRAWSSNLKSLSVVIIFMCV